MEQNKDIEQVFKDLEKLQDGWYPCHTDAGRQCALLYVICKMQQEEIQKLQTFTGKPYEGEDSIMAKVERLEHKVYGE